MSGRAASACVGPSRRAFLASGLLGLPVLRPGHIALAGARFRIIYDRYYGHSHRRYVVIHGDEETARNLLEQHIGTHQGIAFVIENRTRNVPIDGGQIDPNRMFSRAGAEASLKTLNPGWTPERIQAALAALDRGREKLVRALLPPRGGLLIALHNNSDGYSVSNELPASNASSLREPGRPQAFYLCTDPRDYQILT